MSEDGKHGKDPARWEKRYIEGDTPWDSDEPDIHLQWVLEEFDVAPCAAVVIGCGTGTNAVWLSEVGFETVGLDLSATAIAAATQRASDSGATCSFQAIDFLADELPAGTFGMAFDRGCFHCFDEPSERAAFAARVASVLEPEGLWTSVIGSTDGPDRESGPPRRSAADIALAIESHFEILHLESTVFDQDEHAQARAWVLVARRRQHVVQ